VSAQRSFDISHKIHLYRQLLYVAKASSRMRISIRIARILIVNFTIQRYAFGNLLLKHNSRERGALWEGRQRLSRSSGWESDLRTKDRTK
jgi:hypothetical protein